LKNRNIADGKKIQNQKPGQMDIQNINTGLRTVSCMKWKRIVCITLLISILLMLVPPVFADGSTTQGGDPGATFWRKLRQDKHHAVFSADESIAEGDRAKQGGDYVEALGNYNMAIDQIKNSRLAEPEQNKKLAEIYQHKAELYRVRQDLGDDVLATRADQEAESYIEKGTYYGPGSCIGLVVYNRTPLESTVQQVRNFRDESVKKSYTGSRFMEGFNAWYYSFSPSVAGYIGEHSAVKTFMVFDLAPLLGIVFISKCVFSLLSFNSELATVCTIITGGALYGIFYIFPYSSLGMIMLAGRGWNIPKIGRMKSVAVIWLVILIAVCAGSILSLDILTVISSGLLVICSMILSAGIASLAYCRFMLKNPATDTDHATCIIKTMAPECVPE
jgi:hypothetical protein